MQMQTKLGEYHNWAAEAETWLLLLALMPLFVSVWPNSYNARVCSMFSRYNWHCAYKVALCQQQSKLVMHRWLRLSSERNASCKKTEDKYWAARPIARKWNGFSPQWSCKTESTRCHPFNETLSLMSPLIAWNQLYFFNRMPFPLQFVF